MKTNTWSWWEVLLWAYSLLYILFFLAVFIYETIYPEGPHTSDVTPHVNFIMVVLTLPAFIFIILEGIQHLPSKKTPTA